MKPKYLFMYFLNIMLFLSLSILAGVPHSLYGQSQPVVIENGYFKYVIGSDGQNLGFIDKKSGIDYYNKNEALYCAKIKKDGKEYIVSSVTYNNSILKFTFANSNITADIKAEIQNKYILLEVLSVKGGDIESLTFINMPLTLKGIPNEPYAACVISLSLFTRVDHLPALQTNLHASCQKQFGIVGARAALIGVPQSEILPAIKDAMGNAKDMPNYTAGSAWAKDNPYGYGSYLFNFGSLTEENVDE